MLLPHKKVYTHNKISRRNSPHFAVSIRNNSTETNKLITVNLSPEKEYISANGKFTSINQNEAFTLSNKFRKEHISYR